MRRVTTSRLSRSLRGGWCLLVEVRRSPSILFSELTERSGAVGIEMAAELKVVQPHIKITLAHSHSALLSAEPLPEDVKDRALVLTQESGVNVLLDHRLDKAVEKIGDDGSKYLELVFANGHTMNASQVIMAVSRSVPSTDFLPTDALDPDGYVKIRPRCVAILSTAKQRLPAVVYSFLRRPPTRRATSPPATWYPGLASSAVALLCTWATWSQTTSTSAYCKIYPTTHPSF